MTLWLGIDVSTSGVKGCAVEITARGAQLVWSAAQAFPEPAVVRDELEPGSATQHPHVWLAELDAVLCAAREAGITGRCAGVSASAAQHASVWWTLAGAAQLAQLASAEHDMPSLTHQFPRDCFAMTSPTWMDDTPGASMSLLQATGLDDAALAQHTGSAWYARFTGPHIGHQLATAHVAPEAVHRVTLLSGAITAVLCGQLVPPELADAGGMNLVQLESPHAWWELAVRAVAGCAGVSTERVLSMLGEPPVPAQGRPMAPSIAARYGFAPACQVVDASGDNPCTLAGLEFAAPGKHVIAVSLGTSDTVTARCDHPAPVPGVGHIAPHPVYPAAAWYALCCARNGAAVRREACLRMQLPGSSEPSWDLWDDAVGSEHWTGRLLCALHAVEQECLVPAQPASPFVVQVLPGGEVCQVPTDDVSPKQLARALAVGHAALLRWSAGRLGVDVQPNSALLLAGGAGQSIAMQQLAADIWQCPVLRPDSWPSSFVAAAGAAVRAYSACSLMESDATAADSGCAVPSPNASSPVVTPRTCSVGPVAQLQAAMPAIVSAWQQWTGQASTS